MTTDAGVLEASVARASLQAERQRGALQRGADKAPKKGLSMAHRRGNPAQVFQPTSEYFQWVRAGNLIFTAGVIPVDVDRKLVGPGNIEVQTHRVLTNIGLILADAGAGWRDVVKLTTYLADLSTIERMRAARRAFFAEAGVVEYPAANALEIPRLGTVAGILIEVEAIAVVD